MFITLKQFKTDLSAMSAAGKKFDVQSIGCSSIYFSMNDCSIEIYESDIAIFKPNASMEVDIDFGMINTIWKEENTYILGFNYCLLNDMSDIEISVKN